MNEELNRARGRVSYLIESCENGFVRIPRSLLIELRDALPDGGKGEAVYQVKYESGAWLDHNREKYEYFGRVGYETRILYTAPQAECAPREAQPVAKIDADGDFVWLVHNPKFAEGTEFYAAPTPERADAEKDAALTDEQIREIWLRETGFDEQAAPFAILEFARAILAAKEKKS
jgi:hypothetical protein